MKVASSIERPNDVDEEQGAQCPVEESDEANARTAEKGENSHDARQCHFPATYFRLHRSEIGFGVEEEG